MFLGIACETSFDFRVVLRCLGYGSILGVSMKSGGDWHGRVFVSILRDGLWLMNYFDSVLCVLGFFYFF